MMEKMQSFRSFNSNSSNGRTIAGWSSKNEDMNKSKSRKKLSTYKPMDGYIRWNMVKYDLGCTDQEIELAMKECARIQRQRRRSYRDKNGDGSQKSPVALARMFRGAVRAVSFSISAFNQRKSSASVHLNNYDLGEEKNSDSDGGGEKKSDEADVLHSLLASDGVNNKRDKCILFKTGFQMTRSVSCLELPRMVPNNCSNYHEYMWLSSVNGLNGM